LTSLFDRFYIYIIHIQLQNLNSDNCYATEFYVAQSDSTVFLCLYLMYHNATMSPVEYWKQHAHRDLTQGRIIIIIIIIVIAIARTRSKVIILLQIRMKHLQRFLVPGQNWRSSSSYHQVIFLFSGKIYLLDGPFLHHGVHKSLIIGIWIGKFCIRFGEMGV